MAASHHRGPLPGNDPLQLQGFRADGEDRLTLLFNYYGMAGDYGWISRRWSVALPTGPREVLTRQLPGEVHSWSRPVARRAEFTPAVPATRLDNADCR